MNLLSTKSIDEISWTITIGLENTLRQLKEDTSVV